MPMRMVLVGPTGIQALPSPVNSIIIQQVWLASNKSRKFEAIYWKRRLEMSLKDECLMWGIRVIVPHKLRKVVLQELHQSHFVEL